VSHASIDDLHSFAVEARAKSHQERKKVLLCRMRASRMRSEAAIVDELIHVVTNDRVSNPVSELSSVCGLMHRGAPELEQVVSQAAGADDCYPLVRHDRRARPSRIAPAGSRLLRNDTWKDGICAVGSRYRSGTHAP
jgi:hypothetical protein